MNITVANVSKTFGNFGALRNVNLEIRAGELMALLGPSGSGKTTLLRIIAGLERPDANGRVDFSDPDADKNKPEDRRVGFVFQHYALFRHLTVFENIAFGLRVRPRKDRLSKEAIRRRVNELLELIQLEGLAGRYPSQLSGGQRQRVALARTLAVEPRVLLLDEPFGALDARVRQELRRWLRRLHDRIHLTSVFVTHDHEEALELADRVVVMNEGRIEQIGPPEEVFHHPASEFVMNFLGNVNLFRGRIHDGQVFLAPGLGLGTPLGEREPAMEAREPATEASETIRVFVRPHDLNLSLAPEGETSFPATVLRINAAGSRVKVELANAEGAIFWAEISHEQRQSLNLAAGATVYASPRQVRVFSREKPPAETEPGAKAE
ncbi:MAG: sulfate ABC transporter ATP-binding protein [Candidatus Sumerlaeota bacterium]|nr:sulfate ABC transporter ATP-binding protein [Candidatus Sumerlaeota bacterium]